ncbi:MAG TPA: DegT/DnrJ/EryC1/StrS family aminotransferase [Candidatus Omnitrophota bacterium]|nr:DegT/DnrJ/EryC1/StrS family aminotransferase [Candidatus Omnitrophota bacterium]
MMTKLPIIGSAGSLSDALYALMHVPCAQAQASCRARLAAALDAGTAHTADSGIAAFYLALEALKTLSARKEVVLPAYTAGSLVVAVKKAGLKPVLCDISLDDFNADEACVRRAVSGNTLAVVAVHMFGIPVSSAGELADSMPEGAYLIEDCCQAMGARMQDRQAGSFGHISFFSFNRGKNLPANNGGCIIARSSACENAIKHVMSACPEPAAGAWFGAFLKNLLFMAGTNPFMFGIAHSLAAGFRETAPPERIRVCALGNFQSALCLRSLMKKDILFTGRLRNGMALLKGLEGIQGVRLPMIRQGVVPVFNRLPVIFDDAGLVNKAQRALWQNGIESSPMYARPLHHMFDLGYARSDFPNACFLAEHLLTLPVHPGVSERHIRAMADTLRSIA